MKPSRESAKNTKKPQAKTAMHDHTDLTNQILGGIGAILSQISKTRKDIESAVAPKFLDISIHTADLVEHAIELWRLEQRLNKVVSSLDEPQRELFINSIQKLKRYLDKNDIEVVDHTNQEFNDGMNLDVLLVEESPDIAKPTIKETKEPTVLCKNQVVHKGKVIVLTRDGEGAQHE